MYGYGFPIMFPIACVSLLVLYIMEKSMIYFSYRAPPMYDEKLNNSVLDKMIYAPLLYLLFGYWFASNTQIFNNANYVKDTDLTPDKTGHVWKTYLYHYELNPALPLILSFWFLLIVLLLRTYISKFYYCITGTK